MPAASQVSILTRSGSSISLMMTRNVSSPSFTVSATVSTENVASVAPAAILTLPSLTAV